VLCVDDDDLIGQVVRITLKRAGGFQWMGHIRSAQRLVEEAEHLCPDVVLLDIYMPGKDPFIALQELVARCPDVRVIMFSAHVSTQLVDRAFEAGAWGYVSKDEDGDALISALHRVAEGEVVLGTAARNGQRS
jgi:DNA-binding NarL/FixJ family response regulator